MFFRFGEGYTLTIRLSTDEDIGKVQSFMEILLPSARVSLQITIDQSFNKLLDIKIPDLFVLILLPTVGCDYFSIKFIITNYLQLEAVHFLTMFYQIPNVSCTIADVYDVICKVSS